MAVRRTPEEIMEIVGHCLELEAEGGDILSYLWSQNYISPRATWCNFQREHLHRKPYQYTDGKPRKVRKRKETEGMFRVTEEIKGKAIKIALEGGDPKPYLSGLGCEDPVSTWYRIRKDLKDNFPDIAAKLPKRIGPKAEPMKVKPDSKPAEPEKLGPEPAPIVKTVKPYIPLSFDGNKVRGVENELGRFDYDAKFNLLAWNTTEGDEITMTPDRWIMLIEQVGPSVLSVLGLYPAPENKN